jgi:glycosyltransferase involved in cell wall biosynthesis
MRILHVITSLYNGGAERLMVDLLPRLGNDGKNDVELLLFNGVETNFKKELLQRGIKIISLSTTNDVYHPRRLLKLRSIIQQYDIVHTHNTACQLYVAIASCFLRKKPLLITTEHNSTNRRRAKAWLKPFDRWMYNRYAAIVCIAEQTRRNLINYIGDSPKLHTINNGVDVKRFIKPIGQIANKCEFIVTMVAAFRPQKDFETLFRAMNRLPASYRLWIVGGGDRREGERIKAYCTGLGLNDRVEFLGIREDVPGVLEKSDIVVLSSHWEGLSLSSIEGMASGGPFIASDVDGLHDIVKEAGLLFPEGDDKELACQIQFLCQHPDEYKKVALRCQERALQYDISIMAEKHLGLYNELTTNH